MTHVLYSKTLQVRGPNLLKTSFFAVALFAAGVVHAEEPPRGRLPDGTAFRTDAAGSQLVDYVAELEVTVEELLRQVHGLEDELDGLKKGTGSKQPVADRNTAAAVPECVPAAAAPVAFPAELSTCRLSLTTCEQNLDTVKRRVVTNIEDAAKVAVPAVVPASSQPDLRPQVERMQKLLVEKERLLADKERVLADKESALESKEVEVARLRAGSPVSVTAARGASTANRAAPSVPAAAVVAVPVQVPADARASVDLARLQALQAMKGKLHTEYNRLQSQLRMRDGLYDRFRTSPGEVRFTPSRIDGAELRRLSSGIDAGRETDELSTIGARIAELRGRIEADTGLMQRLLRNR